MGGERRSNYLKTKEEKVEQNRREGKRMTAQARPGQERNRMEEKGKERKAAN